MPAASTSQRAATRQVSMSRNGTPAPAEQNRPPQQHRRGSERLPKRRNIDKVFFGNHEIRTWYYSPYPFDDEEWASLVGSQAGPSSAGGAADSLSAASAAALTTAEAAAGTSQGKTGGARGDIAPALQALHQHPGSHPHGRGAGAASPLPPAHGHGASSTANMAKALWICDGCFKYMRTYPGFRAHKKQCSYTHPPGRKVYQRGAHTIWEVDGAEQKLYGQNLSLFGKLFIDHKTIYFDVEPFLFYVLTDASPQFDHVLGFFSKEKVSYDDYNLACIVTLPPAQKKGFGTLMIEFSYYLSSLTHGKDSMLGTPERPLSDLGLQGYLTYWSSVALRSLAIVFADSEPEVVARLLPATYDTDVPARSRFHAQTTAATAALAEERLREEAIRLRRALLGLPPSNKPGPPRHHEKNAARASSDGVNEDSTGRTAAAAARRGMKGWAGEVPRLRPGSRQSHGQHASGNHAGADERDSQDPGSGGETSSHDTQLQLQAAAHPLLQVDETTGGLVQLAGLQTTLERLSAALNLRLDDLCFALSECGLLRRRESAGDESSQDSVKREEAEAAAIALGEDEEDAMDIDGKQNLRKSHASNSNGVDGPRKAGNPSPNHANAEMNAKGNDATPPADLLLVLTRQGVREALERLEVKRPMFDVHYARV